ncbi:hypothetical protein J6590_075956 [Homalodisca vitripennis]|nr:hypothetical protein J6590_075956 [Homalodisca vitripennis]
MLMFHTIIDISLMDGSPGDTMELVRFRGFDPQDSDPRLISVKSVQMTGTRPAPGTSLTGAMNTSPWLTYRCDPLFSRMLSLHMTGIYGYPPSARDLADKITQYDAMAYIVMSCFPHRRDHQFSDMLRLQITGIYGYPPSARDLQESRVRRHGLHNDEVVLEMIRGRRHSLSRNTICLYLDYMVIIDTYIYRFNV